jgi:hypothetical protein
MDFLSDFRLCRKTLSSYYIASMFSFLFFRLVDNLIIDWSVWLNRILSQLTGNVFQGQNMLWFVFFLACFSITMLIRRFFVQGLGFFTDQEGAPTWELTFLTFLVLGGYIYNLNQIFLQPMPTWIPSFLVGMLNGVKVAGASPPNWEIIPWLWDITPILFLFMRTKLDFKSE